MKISTYCTALLLLLCFCSTSLFGAVALNFLNANQVSSYVQVDWESSSENNNDYYTLERSIDSVNYSTITTVGGAGSTANTSNYSFNDVNVVASQTYHYRLISTEFSGFTDTHDTVTITISSPASVNVVTNTTFSIHPNPVDDNLIIRNATNFKTASIYNATGKIIQSFELTAFTSIINIGDLPKGIYLVKLIGKKKTYTQKLIKN